MDRLGEKVKLIMLLNCIFYVQSIIKSMNAIRPENELKGWTRARKNLLIETMNRDWRFLNEEVPVG